MQKNQQAAVEVVLAVLGGESLTAKLQMLWVARSNLAPGDRGAIQDLSYGTLRHLSELRAYVDLMVSKPVTDDSLRVLLCIGLYQLSYTRNAPHAVVNEAVGATRVLGIPWAKGLVNALLRRFLREKYRLQEKVRSVPSTCYSYPSWWIERLKQDHPEHCTALLEEGNRRPGMTLRVNRRRISPVDYLEALALKQFPATAIGESGVILDHPVAVEQLPGFDRGWVSVQDYGAQLVPGLLDARDGMRVCDACAAPGGKTAHLLETHELDMTALEVNPARMQRIRETLNRLGLDARLVCTDAADLSAWWDGKAYDRVLLDAPCSASGVVRRHPDSKWLRRDDDIPRFAAQQRRLLDALWQVIQPGGKLLYVTCSVFKAENEEVIASFTEGRRDAALAPSGPPLDCAGHLKPSATNDGFYYALLAKTQH